MAFLSNTSRSVLVVSLILALTVLVACGTAAPEVVEREVVQGSPGRSTQGGRGRKGS